MLLLYPLPGESETSKPVEVAAVIFPVKLLPLTVNCSTCGLAEAVPAQAEMLPDKGPVMMAGGVARAGFTVIVNLTGEPLQPGPAEIKFPYEIGYDPALIVAIMALVAVLITETVFPLSETYSRLPSGVIDMPWG